MLAPPRSASRWNRLSKSRTIRRRKCNNGSRKDRPQMNTDETPINTRQTTIIFVWPGPNREVVLQYMISNIRHWR